jgi:hypothetical protein
VLIEAARTLLLLTVKSKALDMGKNPYKKGFRHIFLCQTPAVLSKH